MAIINLTDKNGNAVSPKTTADAVYVDDTTKLNDKITSIENTIANTAGSGITIKQWQLTASKSTQKIALSDYITDKTLKLKISVYRASKGNVAIYGSSLQGGYMSGSLYDYTNPEIEALPVSVSSKNTASLGATTTYGVSVDNIEIDIFTGTIINKRYVGETNDIGSNHPAISIFAGYLSDPSSVTMSASSSSDLKIQIMAIENE